MLQKIDELFSGMPYVFIIADDILIAGFNEQGRNHSAISNKNLGICRQASMNFSKHKCLFRCMSIPFFGEVVSQHSVTTDPQERY